MTRTQTDHLTCDVAIVGGGPAGSTAAYWLARAGHEVVVVDRACFPRYKTCAGGLERKTVALFDFSLDPVIERVTDRLWGSCMLRRPLIRDADKPLVYCVMRDRFDAFLLDKAKASGVAVLEGERALAIEERGDSVLIKTSHRAIRAKIVVGADGALSVVRRTLYPALRIERFIGAQAEVSLPMSDLERLTGTILMDMGALPGGYAWAFPKRDQLSVGAEGPLSLNKQVKAYVFRFLTMLVQEGVVGDCKVERISCHLLPMAMPAEAGDHRLHTARTVLAGDAAGLVDPLTGEGIYYAVRSARLAAEVISGALKDARGQQDTPGKEGLRRQLAYEPDLAGYTEEIRSTLLPEITSARSFRYVHSLSPTGFHAWLRRSDRLWNGLTRSFAGEKTYASWRAELGGAEPLWPAIDRIAATTWRWRVRWEARRKV